jgi:hypothetical protein
MTTLNFTTSNVNVNSTSLQGYIQCNYVNLCAMFGAPVTKGLDKSDAEWSIKFDDGQVATIYNWKNGKNYNGDAGMATHNIIHWHVGGKSPAVVERIEQLILQQNQVMASIKNKAIPQTPTHHLEMVVGFDEVEVDVFFEYEAGQPTTWDEPGYAEEIYIKEVKVKGVDILSLLSQETIDEIEGQISTAVTRSADDESDY